MDGMPKATPVTSSASEKTYQSENIDSNQTSRLRCAVAMSWSSETHEATGESLIECSPSMHCIGTLKIFWFREIKLLATTPPFVLAAAILWAADPKSVHWSCTKRTPKWEMLVKPHGSRADMSSPTPRGAWISYIKKLPFASMRDISMKIACILSTFALSSPRTSPGLKAFSSLHLRGGAVMPPVTENAEIGKMESKDIWEKVYLDEGFSRICEETFEVKTIGKNLQSEDDGRTVRNTLYGASSARTRRPMRYGDRPYMHYFEAQLFGGGPPLMNWTGIEVEGKWYSAEEVCGDGTIASTIGVVAGGTLTCFDNSTMPDDCFVYYAAGCVRWPWKYNEWSNINAGMDPRTALSKLIPAQQKDENKMCSGDRIGVLVDLYTNKIGFFRNGELIPEYSRSLAPHVPPLVLRFMVGGFRENTTWTMCSREQGMQTLAQLDWKEWVTDINPNCIDWRPLWYVQQNCSPEMVEEYRRYVHDYLEEVRKNPPPPGEFA